MKKEHDRLHAALDHSAAAIESRDGPRLAPAVAGLERWQKRRLQGTYADLSRQDRYRAATRFFTEELYAPPNLLDRDQDLRRMAPYMVRMLPPSAVNTVAVAVEVQALTLQLDVGITRTLLEWDIDPEDMDSTDYAAAYQQRDERADRRRQIELIIEVGRDLDGLVSNPFIYTTLKLCKTPARLLHLVSLHDFLVSGFTSFRAMHGADEFLGTIQQRETRILEALMSGDSSVLGGESGGVPGGGPVDQVNSSSN